VRGDLSRLLGTAPIAPSVTAAAPEAASRFRLFGIVAPKFASSGAVSVTQGVALIAVDGKMPKAYAVGARLDNDLVLQSVSLRKVSIASSSQGAPTITLELPPPAAAATGMLPSTAATGGMPTMPMPTSPAPVPQYAPPPGAAPSMLPQNQPAPIAPPARTDGNAPTQ
jgi:general secretion pathway protein C